MLDDTGQDARQAIRERAYALWQQAGSPEGREEEFWHLAEAEAAPSDVVVPSETEMDQDIKDSFPASDATNRS